MKIYLDKNHFPSEYVLLQVQVHEEIHEKNARQFRCKTSINKVF